MNQLCPDRQLLSVYFDGELPSPWKEKMESHIAVCPHCARQLQIYQNISLASSTENTASAEEPSLVSALERIWQKLEQGAGDETPAQAVPNRHRIYPDGRAVWRRRISIPIPAAAAALVMMAALAFLMGFRVTGTPGNSGMSAGMTFASEAEFEMPGIISASDMENMMQFFDSRDNSDAIILRLPEIPGFESYGEPAILTAADYSRQMPGWRK
jgi:anti-sigma factor RsiW